jgi:hypothetical protein
MSAPSPRRAFKLSHWQHVNHGELLTGQQRCIFENFAENFTLTRQYLTRALFEAQVGKNYLVVDSYLVNTVMAFNQFSLQTELFVDGGRQPGSPVIKTSLNAIRDSNIFFWILYVWHYSSLASYPADNFIRLSVLVVDDFNPVGNEPILVKRPDSPADDLLHADACQVPADLPRIVGG